MSSRLRVGAFSDMAAKLGRSAHKLAGKIKTTKPILGGRLRSSKPPPLRKALNTIDGPNGCDAAEKKNSFRPATTSPPQIRRLCRQTHPGLLNSPNHRYTRNDVSCVLPDKTRQRPPLPLRQSHLQNTNDTDTSGGAFPRWRVSC